MHHNRAILARMSPAEREFFEREPARSWLAQMGKKLHTMTVEQGALVLRENMASLAPPRRPAASAAPSPVEALAFVAPPSMLPDAVIRRIGFDRDEDGPRAPAPPPASPARDDER